MRAITEGGEVQVMLEKGEGLAKLSVECARCLQE